MKTLRYLALVACLLGLLFQNGITQTQQFPSSGGGGTANSISFTPTGTIEADNVQDAIVEVNNEAGGGSGQSVALDLADNGSNESTALTEIATTGDTNGVFTEPSADKLFIDLTKDWPKSDLADALAANPTDCSANQFANAIAANGNLTCAQPAFSDLSGSISDGQIPSAITRDTELSAHESDTTSIHGIADTSTLVTLSPASTTLTGLTGATATATDLIPGNCINEGVRIKVTSAVTGATGINVGTASQANLWGENIAVALNTTTDIEDFLVSAPSFYRSATSVVLTAVGSNFTGGNVQVVAYCRTLPAIP